MYAFNYNSIHMPNLDTVLMIEKHIQENSGEHRRTALWKSLPRRPQYQTFRVTVEYLLHSGKIAEDSEGKLCWIWDPDFVREMLKKKHLIIR
ncbi:MAG: hypothetical protein L0Z54_02760 [Thermoplasmata archaeon]|nr:hypothetical protein [Thermoplasmata archaeon]